MLKNKRAAIPAIGVIIFMLVVTIVLISGLLVIFEVQNIYIDDNKIDTQLAINTLLDSSCLSDNYGYVEESKFNQENLDSCFKGLKDNILLKIQLPGEETIYAQTSKEDFDSKASLCTLKSNQLCTQMKYPITYLGSDSIEELKTLSIIVITT